MLTHSELKKNVEYQDPTADLDLISSDGVLFRVHSYQLKAASSVFRELLETSVSADTTPTIELTDEECEGEKPILLFLNCIYRSPQVTDDIDNWLLVLKLFDKYNCDRLRECFINSLWRILGDSPICTPLQIFTIASHVDDVDLAQAAIHSVGWNWCSDNENQEYDLHDLVTDYSMFDLRAAPFKYYCRIEPRYAHALLRATLKLSENPEREEIQEASKRFKVIFNKAFPKSPR